MRERVLVLDGAMGTAIQRDRPDEAGYRGERFADWPSDLQGNNDLLDADPAGPGDRDPRGVPRPPAPTSSRPTPSTPPRSPCATTAWRTSPTRSTTRRRSSPGPPSSAVSATDPSRPRYVAGALGPTTRTASISPDVNDPGMRNVSFTELHDAYLVAARGLVDGGADLLLIETIFDTLNAKAAISAVEALFAERGRRWPVGISGTITDASGRTLSGQTTEAFWHSVRHARPLVRGAELRPRRAGDAALPRRDRPGRGHLRLLLPQRRAAQRLRGVRRSRRGDRSDRRGVRRLGLLNLVGGCCGTTPQHIGAIAARVEGAHPARGARGAARAAAVRPGAGDRHRGHAVRQRGGADQHHRLGPVPQPHQVRRLRHRADRRPPAGRGRRAGHRRQHGRGHDRRRRGHGPLHQAHRLRARHQPGAADDRLLQVGGHRDRPAQHPGQADRELDLA